jgi:hypothetical protein
VPSSVLIMAVAAREASLQQYHARVSVVSRSRNSPKSPDRLRIPTRHCSDEFEPAPSSTASVGHEPKAINPPFATTTIDTHDQVHNDGATLTLHADAKASRPGSHTVKPQT